MKETDDFDGYKRLKLELFVRNCNIKLSGQCDDGLADCRLADCGDW